MSRGTKLLGSRVLNFGAYSADNTTLRCNTSTRRRNHFVFHLVSHNQQLLAAAAVAHACGSDKARGGPNKNLTNRVWCVARVNCVAFAAKNDDCRLTSQRDGDLFLLSRISKDRGPR